MDITEYNYDESIMNDYDPTNPAGLESVEELKEDLKNMLKPKQKKRNKKKKTNIEGEEYTKETEGDDTF